jgi:dihydrofolate reductase
MSPALSPSLALLLTLPPPMWAGNAVVGRLLVGQVPPLMLNALRWALAALLLAPLAWRVWRDGGAVRGAWVYLLVIGTLGVGVFNSLQYVALAARQRCAGTRVHCRGDRRGHRRGAQRQSPAMTRLVLIAALDRQRAIGRDGGLLWQEREDQRHFRRVTMGCPVIMGRKTWDSLPARFRPLPGRCNIVVTRDVRWQAPGAEAAPSLDAALALVAGAEKVFVIGGGELYALALAHADEMMLTEIDTVFDGADTFFPDFDRPAFLETAREPRTAADGMRYAFVTYRRAAG